jgi:hypothetical protein
VGTLTLGGARSNVVQGGQITFEQLFESYIGSGQAGIASGVTITIAAATTPGGGSDTPVATTSSGILPQGGSQSLYDYTWSVPASQATGDYLVTWAGTVGSTTLTYTTTVTVAAIATGNPAPGVYATLDAYRAWSGDTITPDLLVSVTLQRASEDIDNALIGAVYAVNGNGMPTDAMVIHAVSRATCAQCQYLLADNDPTLVKKQYTTTNVGGVATTRAASTVAPQFPLLGPRAAQILHIAGVLPSAALIAW